MGGKAKIWIGIALSLILIGGLVFVIIMSANGWDFSKMGASKLERNVHVVTEEFDGISVETNTADVNILSSQNGECRVECYEKASAKHSVFVRDGKLTVQIEDNGKWYEDVWNFGTPTITIYLPLSQYSTLRVDGITGDVELSHGFRFGSMDIKLTTGDIECKASAGSMSLKVTTGDIELDNVTADVLDVGFTTGGTELNNVTCETLKIKGTTGGADLYRVVALGSMSVELSTGDVSLKLCDGGEISIKTTTGSVVGSFATDKVIFANSSTGRVDVPRLTTGGRCEITTTTGDIRITIG